MKYVLVSGGQHCPRAVPVKIGRVLTEFAGVISGIGKGVIGTCVLKSAHMCEWSRRGEGRLIENSLFYRSFVEDDRA